MESMKWMTGDEIKWQELFDNSKYVVVHANHTDWFGVTLDDYWCGYICTLGDEEYDLDTWISGRRGFGGKISDVIELAILN